MGKEKKTLTVDEMDIPQLEEFIDNAIPGFNVDQVERAKARLEQLKKVQLAPGSNVNRNLWERASGALGQGFLNVGRWGSELLSGDAKNPMLQFDMDERIYLSQVEQAYLELAKSGSIKDDVILKELVGRGVPESIATLIVQGKGITELNQKEIRDALRNKTSVQGQRQDQGVVLEGNNLNPAQSQQENLDTKGTVPEKTGSENPASGKGNNLVSNADPNTGRQIRQEGVPQATGAVRAPITRNDLLDQSDINTQKTPQELNDEYYQRLADLQNNQLYYKPGVTRFGAGSGTQQISEGGVYQQPKLEFEETRNQLINRARRGDKLAYQELGRFKEANDVLYKIRGGQELDINDVEKIRNVNNEQLLQMMDMSQADLWARFNELNSNINYYNALQTWAASKHIDMDKARLIYAAYRNAGYSAAFTLAHLWEASVPPVVDEKMANTFSNKENMAKAEQFAKENM